MRSIQSIRSYCCSSGIKQHWQMLVKRFFGNNYHLINTTKQSTRKPCDDYLLNVSYHYNDVIMGAIASQITSRTIVFSTVYSDTDKKKHQSSASLAFVWGIHRRPVNSPHKWPVTQTGRCFHLMTSSCIHHAVLFYSCTVTSHEGLRIPSRPQPNFLSNSLFIRTKWVTFRNIDHLWR